MRRTVHYDQGLAGRARRAGLVPVCIDVGGSATYMGAVTHDMTTELLDLIVKLRRLWPADQLPMKDETPEQHAARLGVHLDEPLALPPALLPPVVTIPEPPPPPPPPVSSVPLKIAVMDSTPAKRRHRKSK